jgi:hypothetical protein
MWYSGLLLAQDVYVRTQKGSFGNERETLLEMEKYPKNVE